MNRNPLQAMALTSAIVSQLAGGPLAGIFIGKWTDQHFHTSPTYMIVGLIIGLAAGITGTIHLVSEHMGED